MVDIIWSTSNLLALFQDCGLDQPDHLKWNATQIHIPPY